jgi:hypothetical protein
MIVSRASASVIALVLSALAALSATAQQVTPAWKVQVQTSPGSGPRDLRPRHLRPTTPAPAKAAPDLKRRSQGSARIITVDPLASVDPEAVGTLTPATGALPIHMWRGTRRTLAMALLERLPVRTTSPAMRHLMRRLLLTAATPPAGKTNGGSLVALRARLLSNMGEVDALDDLLKATPSRNQDPSMIREAANLRLLSNDVPRACALTAGRISDQGDPFWQKSFIFCQILSGEHDKASLGVALLQEMGEEDAPFFTLVDKLGGGDGALKSLTDPSALHLAMAVAAKAQLPADVVKSTNPGVLRAVAMNANVGMILRLESAERAETAGVLPTDLLRQLYAGLSFPEEELADPLSGTENRKGPVMRAFLYRAASNQTIPTARAEVLMRVLELARAEGMYDLAARTFMPLILRVPASTELTWFAPLALRAMIATSRNQAAKAWFNLLRTGALYNRESKAALTSLLAIARLAGSDDAANWGAGHLESWWAGERGRDGAKSRATRLFAMMAALGDRVTPALWEAVIDDTDQGAVTMPQPALWLRLEGAAGGGQVGETALLSLIALGKDGPGQANPIVLGRVFSALAAVGLESDARVMAVEAALAAGL